MSIDMSVTSHVMSRHVVPPTSRLTWYMSAYLKTRHFDMSRHVIRHVGDMSRHVATYRDVGRWTNMSFADMWHVDKEKKKRYWEPRRGVTRRGDTKLQEETRMGDKESLHSRPTLTPTFPAKNMKTRSVCTGIAQNEEAEIYRAQTSFPNQFVYLTMVAV